MNDCTEERFLKDIAQHEMIVVRDDGVNRHLRFKKPGTNCMQFDLITWHGHLCYTGDMGTYVFRRLADMFEFFRTDQQRSRDGQTLHINPSYWGEKLEAIDQTDGYRKWSREKFVALIRERFEEWIAEECAPEKAEDIKEQFEDEVIGCLEDGEQENAYHVAQSFEVDGQNPFQDWWEVNTEEYTYRYIWCCYALAWGVQKYDDTNWGDTGGTSRLTLAMSRTPEMKSTSTENRSHD